MSKSGRLAETAALIAELERDFLTPVRYDDDLQTMLRSFELESHQINTLSQSCIVQESTELPTQSRQPMAKRSSSSVRSINPDRSPHWRPRQPVQQPTYKSIGVQADLQPMHKSIGVQADLQTVCTCHTSAHSRTESIDQPNRLLKPTPRPAPRTVFSSTDPVSRHELDTILDELSILSKSISFISDRYSHVTHIVKSHISQARCLDEKISKPQLPVPAPRHSIIRPPRVSAIYSDYHQHQ